RRALALASPRGMRPLVAHCHLGLGKLYRRTGKRQEECEELSTATTMYREMDMQFWAKQADPEPNFPSFTPRPPAPGPAPLPPTQRRAGCNPNPWPPLPGAVSFRSLLRRHADRAMVSLCHLPGAHGAGTTSSNRQSSTEWFPTTISADVDGRNC